MVLSNRVNTVSYCNNIIKNFDYSGWPKMITAYSLPCPTSADNVVVTAEGMAPLSYSITTKDNLPFALNNLTSNIFTGLQPEVYNFQVQDVCGNVVNRLFDIASLPQPAVSQGILCTGQNGSLQVQNFSFLNYQWWKGINTSTILSTNGQQLPFFASSIDARAGHGIALMRAVYYFLMISLLSLALSDVILNR